MNPLAKAALVDASFLACVIPLAWAIHRIETFRYKRRRSAGLPLPAEKDGTP